jgi:hypothetical protein
LELQQAELFFGEKTKQEPSICPRSDGERHLPLLAHVLLLLLLLLLLWMHY